MSDDNNTTNQLTITENKNTRDFIKTIAQDAHDIGQDEDIYASVMIAQAILESDSGMSALAQAPHYNLFGIKELTKENPLLSILLKTMETTCSKSQPISVVIRVKKNH